MTKMEQVIKCRIILLKFLEKWKKEVIKRK